MTEFSGVRNIRGWFLGKGPESDVVVSTRVRLSRNLAEIRFPGSMTIADETEVKTRVRNAFDGLTDGVRYEYAELSGLSPLERRVLLERTVITRDTEEETGKALLLRDDELVSCMVNEIDHLRLSCYAAGLSLSDAYDTLDDLDTRLEDALGYAVSFELGYLNTEITNIGTGLKASVMLHLPALAYTSLIDKAVKVVNQLGLSVKGFMDDGDKSLGDMYQVSNQVGLGLSERDILEKLEGVTLQLVNYERKAREEMMSKRRIDLEDGVFRAYGLLSYARSISSREAIELLSALRLGIALGLVKDVPLETVTTLLFFTQQAHVRLLAGEALENAESAYVDYARAGLIHEFLSRNTLRGGTEHV
jgi:protein arginine kinase